MAPTFVNKEVRTPKMAVKLELEFNRCGTTPEEVAESIRREIELYHNKEFSAFVIWLMRQSKASTYEIKSMSVDEVK